MPHAELKYSNDLEIDTKSLLCDVEATILQHDDGSGECKGRGYPSAEFHHSHCLLSISMLTKAHRDEAFTQALIKDLEQLLKSYLPKRCYYSLGINYSSATYITSEYVPEV